jgi:hypothetical protein
MSLCVAVGQLTYAPLFGVVVNPGWPTPDAEPSDAWLGALTCHGSSGRYTCYAVGSTDDSSIAVGAVETITIGAPPQPPCKALCQ